MSYAYIASNPLTLWTEKPPNVVEMYLGTDCSVNIIYPLGYVFGHTIMGMYPFQILLTSWVHIPSQ